MQVCDFCIHDNLLSSDFPCNECKHIGNGDSDMFVGKGEDGEEKKSRILDSGSRTAFSTGAVRDIQEGKGRCDLMPLDVISELYFLSDFYEESGIFKHLHDFTETGDCECLMWALDSFTHYPGWSAMFLEVAKHFEEGAKKYGENNWQKGIPVKRYIDSGVRHYLKFIHGDKDEPHDRAFVWNIICAIWTCMHKPELNDYAKENADIPWWAVDMVTKEKVNAED